MDIESVLVSCDLSLCGLIGISIPLIGLKYAAIANTDSLLKIKQCATPHSIKLIIVCVITHSTVMFCVCTCMLFSCSSSSYGSVGRSFSVMSFFTVSSWFIHVYSCNLFSASVISSFLSFHVVCQCFSQPKVK